MIEHAFTEAVSASTWWAGVTEILADEKKNAAMIKAATDAGFYNHQFLPLGDGQTKIVCVWESYSGNAQDMQAFIDGDLSPAQGLHNTVTPINPQANLGFKPYFSDTLLLNSKWPRGADTITKEWLSVLMGREVISFTKQLLEKGVLSDAAICTCTYNSSDSRTARANSVVVKYAKADDTVRLMSIPVYKKELLAYGALKDQLGLQLPEVYGTWEENGLAEGWFCIAMENLCEKNNLLDQTTGITPVQQRSLVDIIARFNAKHYKNPVLQDYPFLSAIQQPDAKSKPMFIPWFDQFFQAFRADITCYGGLQAALDRRPDLNLSATLHGDPYFMAIIDFMTGPTGVATIDKVYEMWATRPRTLCHGDARCENIFESKTDGSYTFIDWQMVSLSPPGCEVMQLLGFSMQGSSADLSNYDKIVSLVDYYYATLVSNAPGIAADGYTLEMCKADFALAMPIAYMGICAAFIPVLMAIPTEHYLWDGYAFWSSRLTASMKQMQTLEELQKVEKTLA